MIFEPSWCQLHKSMKFGPTKARQFSTSRNRVTVSFSAVGHLQLGTTSTIEVLLSSALGARLVFQTKLLDQHWRVLLVRECREKGVPLNSLQMNTSGLEQP